GSIFTVSQNGTGNMACDYPANKPVDFTVAADPAGGITKANLSFGVDLQDCGWKATIDAADDWITSLTPTSGLGSATVIGMNPIQIGTQGNPIADRDGKVFITGHNGAVTTINVHQPKNTCVFDFTPEEATGVPGSGASNKTFAVALDPTSTSGCHWTAE